MLMSYDMNTACVPAGSRTGIRRAVKIDCELVSPRNDAPLRFVATDLSTGGIFLQTADPVRAGEQVVVCFEPRVDWPLGELMVFAEVARVTTSRRRVNEPGIGMGLEFLDLENRERKALDRWLAQHRAPVPRRRRPVPQVRFSVPQPEVGLSFDEIRGTTAVNPVDARPNPPSAPAPVSRPTLKPIQFRPLASAWR
jgi:Tfp pilus assembly protein PilZ